MVKGGAVATTAKGDNPKRDEVATGASLYNIYSQRPVLTENAFRGWRHLIVKDNSKEQRISNGELLRVARFVMTLGKMKATENYVFEKGDQNRNHIHILVRAPKLYDLNEMTKQFRMQQRLHYEVERKVYFPVSNDFEDLEEVAHIEEWIIDLSPITFEIQLLTSNDHMFWLIEEYFYKEQKRKHPINRNIEFTDDLGPNPNYDNIMLQLANV